MEMWSSFLRHAFNKAHVFQPSLVNSCKSIEDVDRESPADNTTDCGTVLLLTDSYTADIP